MADDKADRVPVRVEFLIVSFGQGDEKHLRIWPGDVLDIQPSGNILIMSRAETVEAIVMRAEHIRWYSISEGMALPPLTPDERAEVLRDLLKAHDPGAKP